MKYIKLLALFFVGCATVFSCSSESVNIKRALRTSIPEVLQSDYKLKEYSIIETILDANIRDSISSQRSKIMSNEMLMKSDSTRLLNVQNEIKTCRYQQATTLSWLRSSYNSIIRTYEDMEDEIIEKLEDRQAENTKYASSVEKMESALASTDSPIIYYKVHHNYTMSGAIRDTVVTLDSKYNLLTE